MTTIKLDIGWEMCYMKLIIHSSHNITSHKGGAVMSAVTHSYNSDQAHIKDTKD